MKTELIINPEDQKILDLINNVSDYWYEFQLPEHPIYSQFNRKLVVKGFNNPDMDKPEERIYVSISQVLYMKKTNEFVKEIKMPQWMIHEGNVEEVLGKDGVLTARQITKDELGNIIEEKIVPLKAPSVKYVKFLIKSKTLHLVDVLEKFVGQYIGIFKLEIDNI